LVDTISNFENCLHFHDFSLIKVVQNAVRTLHGTDIALALYSI